MSLSSFGFMIEEAGRNVRRSGHQAIVALSTVTVALAVLGGALFTLHRLHQFVDVQPRRFDIQVFMRSPDLDSRLASAQPDHSTAHRRRRRRKQPGSDASTFSAVAQVDAASRQTTLDVQRRIQALPGVQTVALFTKEQALADWQTTDTKNGTSIAAALPGNPLPDRLDVHVAEPQYSAAVADALRNQKRFPEIEHVADDRQTVEALVRLSRLVGNVGGIVAIVLCLGTALVIQNTIRLTVFARRREIRIMQLVGATPAFIRFPMVLEGVFYGVVGAGIATAIVVLSLRQLSSYVAALHSPLMAQSLPQPLGVGVMLGALMTVGAAVGWVGSTLSVRRYLRRI